MSPSVQGTKNRGSIYIRGIKGEGGFDSYKFVLEKSVQFHELDSEIILRAYEEAYKNKQKTMGVTNRPGDDGSIKRPIK